MLLLVVLLLLHCCCGNWGFRHCQCLSDRLEDHQLWQCLEPIIASHNQHVLAELAGLQPARLAVGIVTLLTTSILPYAAYAIAVNLAYAMRHHYVFYPILLDSERSAWKEKGYDTNDVRWNKVKALQDSLHTWGAELDYVLWVDADLIMINIDRSLQAVLTGNFAAHLIVSAEHGGSSTLINSGAVLVKNSAWAKDLLRRWWTFANRTLYSDQEQFDMIYQQLLQTRSAELRRIKILPGAVLNSNPPAMTEQQSSDPVLHLMGEDDHYRAQAFHHGWKVLCEASTPTAAPHFPEQLSLSQPYLLSLALELYYPAAIDLLRSLRRRIMCLRSARCGLASKRRSLLSSAEARRLSNVIHHLAHACEYVLSRSTQSLQLSAKAVAVADRLSLHDLFLMRQEVFSILKTNVVAMKNVYVASEGDEKTIPFDYPELLKTAAVAGQHLLSPPFQLSRGLQGATAAVEATENISEEAHADVFAVADELHTLLSELLTVAHPQQRGAILQMIAHVYSEEGIAYIDGHQPTRALSHFEQALAIADELSEQGGRHLLITPLSHVANTLATLGRLEEAIIFYDQCLKIVHSYVANRQDSRFMQQHLINIHANYGLALMQLQKFDQACDHFRWILSEAELRPAPRTNNPHEESIDDQMIRYRIQDSLRQHQISCFAMQ